MPDIVVAICGVTASRISDMSHDAIWDAAYTGEEIAIYAVLAADEDIAGSIAAAERQP